MRKWTAGLLLAAVAGCSAPAQAIPASQYDDQYYADKVCRDLEWTRVPDEYCPIGDNIPGYQFQWAWDEYTEWDLNTRTVYVGYPVDRIQYVATRPPRVQTLHVRAGIPARPAPGVSSSSFELPTMPAERKAAEVKRSPTITRGGLGVATPAPSAPKPKLGVSANARRSDPPKQQTAVQPKKIADPPKVRPMAPPKAPSVKVKTGK